MRERHQRRGAIIVLAAICMVIAAAMLAFTVNIGLLLSARTEMQRSADAAALAGAWRMVSDDILRGDTDSIDAAARNTAVDFAAMNQVIQTKPRLDFDADIRLGYLSNPMDHNEELSFSDPSQYNTVEVFVQYSAERNTPIAMFFAPLIGVKSADLAVMAAAMFDSKNTIGFRPTESTGNSSLMPFAVKNEDWNNMLDGAGEDNWTYDPETGTVSAGPDGIPEMRMFPEKDKGSSNKKNKNNGSGITPGNFGTVDIGNTNNSAKDLLRQIREGASAEDMSYYPNGELKLDSQTGTLPLNGDTGITASMKNALVDIVGHPRTILLYDDVSGQGNNAWFTINGFAGMRVMDFALTGGDKYILIQPAVVVDPTAVSGSSDNASQFVGPPVRLVR